MKRRDHAGFTVIELLVVIGIIAVLLGLLIPAIAGAQLRSDIASCVSNAGQIAQATVTYTRDYRNYYPSQTGDTTLIVVGGPGRLLSPYTDNSQDVAQCPLDSGYAPGGALPAPYVPDAIPSFPDRLYLANTRSSYRYIDDDTADYTAYAGAIAVESQRVTEFKYPSKKTVIADAVLGNGPTSTVNQWHNSSDPLKGGMGFADGSSQEIERKTTYSTITTTTTITVLERERYY